MTQYRRSFVPGGTFFFTVCLQDRSQSFLTDHVGGLRNSFRLVRAELPFVVEAVVILPDHLHTIWTLPSGDSNYSARWRRIKARFSRSIVDKEPRSASRVSKGERGIWQRRFWEHLIRDEQDYFRHVDYIHYNPAKHGHCTRATEWPYSSFHQYVRRGDLPLSWSGEVTEDDMNDGE